MVFEVKVPTIPQYYDGTVYTVMFDGEERRLQHDTLRFTAPSRGKAKAMLDYYLRNFVKLAQIIPYEVFHPKGSIERSRYL